MGARVTGDGTDDHATTFSFCFAEPRASAVAAAVGVEVGEIDDERSGATVAREPAPEGDCEDDRDAPADGRDATEAAVPEAVVVRIAAGDLVALRASANTWTRLVGTAAQVAETAAAYAPESAGR